MKLVAAVAIAAALLAAGKPKPPRAAAPPAAPPPPQAKIVRAADGWRVDLTLDRPLLGWALPRAHDGTRTLFLLTGPARETPEKKAAADCGPKAEGAGRKAQLFRWRFDDPEHLESLGTDLPEGSLDAADVDGDGDEDLVLARDGVIDRIASNKDGPATIGALIQDPELATSSGGPRIAWGAAAVGDAALRVSLLGAFRTYRAAPRGGVALASELDMPVRVGGGPELFRVRSPAVQPVGRNAAGRMLFATEPEELGKRRLRTLLLDPDGPEESRVVESWAMFPQPERLVDRSFAILRGAPVLIVATTSAEKLSLLGEKALRVFPLGGDRTRAGDAPSFAATTGINLWQGIHPTILDLDRDGRDDLVLAYWKGLKNAIAAFEVYRGVAGGGFAKARTMSFEVDDGKKGFMAFGGDLDGDGRPDLVLLAGSELQIYPGSPVDKAVDRPVDSRPSRRIALPGNFPQAGNNELNFDSQGLSVSRRAGGLGTPVLIDVDGDGRPEAVFAGNAGKDEGRATILFVRGAP